MLYHEVSESKKTGKIYTFTKNYIPVECGLQSICSHNYKISQFQHKFRKTHYKYAAKLNSTIQ
jgi:hypothetical protein